MKLIKFDNVIAEIAAPDTGNVKDKYDQQRKTLAKLKQRLQHVRRMADTDEKSQVMVLMGPRFGKATYGPIVDVTHMDEESTEVYASSFGDATRVMIRDFKRYPTKYLVIPSDRPVSGFIKHDFPMIFIFHKGTMSQMGLDKDDAEDYVDLWLQRQFAIDQEQHYLNRIAAIENTPITEAATKRKLNTEMSTARAIQLLQKRIHHYNSTPQRISGLSKVKDRIPRVENGKNTRVAMLDLSQVKDPRVISNYLSDTDINFEDPVVSIIRDYLNHPDWFIVVPVPGYHPAKNIPYEKKYGLDHLPFIYIFNKQRLEDAGLDRDDAEDFADASLTAARHYDQKHSYEAQLKKLQKKFDAEQLEQMRTSVPTTAQATQKVYNSPNEPGAPPARLPFSDHIEASNPYYSGPDHRYVGDPLHAPYQNGQTKSMMKIFILACNNVGHPLTLVYYSHRPAYKIDEFFAESADKVIRIWVGGSYKSDKVISINGWKYDLDTFYTPGNVNTTTSTLKFYLEASAKKIAADKVKNNTP